MTKKVTVYRQGDVNLMETDTLPKDAEVIPPVERGVVLAYGEVTGHAHTLSPSQAKLYKVGSSGKEYVRVTTKNAVLSHNGLGGSPGDHDSIELPRGVYELRIAREETELGVSTVID